jgi:hypothetical protein
MRFVFRRSGSLIGLYIGLVFAYGSLGYFKETEIETIKRFLTGGRGFGVAPFLLRWIYLESARALNSRAPRFARGSAATEATAFLPSWLSHGLKWVVVFVIPLAALWVGQTKSKVPEVDRAASAVSDVPKSARARVRYGLALQDAGQLEAAAEQYRFALGLDPIVQMGIMVWRRFTWRSRSLSKRLVS